MLKFKAGDLPALNFAFGLTLPVPGDIMVE